MKTDPDLDYAPKSDNYGTNCRYIYLILQRNSRTIKVFLIFFYC